MNTIFRVACFHGYLFLCVTFLFVRIYSFDLVDIVYIKGSISQIIGRAGKYRVSFHNGIKAMAWIATLMVSGWTKRRDYC